jgi:acylphosphatase
MTSVGADIRVSGMVQGVGFRHFCWRKATQLELVGWVRNLPDGSVSIHAEGDRGTLEALIDELRVGPANASVTDVGITWTPFTGKHQSFLITA